MDFLSGMGRQKLVLRPASTTLEKTPDGKSVRHVDPGLRVQFRRLGAPIHTDAFFSKDGLAWGVLSTGPVAKKLRINEEELIDMLLNHPKHGELFGRVGERGEKILPEMLHIIPSGDGHYCKLCKKSLDKRGVHNHPKSKEHQERLAGIEAETREAIAG
jgi:hypothetical protein